MLLLASADVHGDHDVYRWLMEVASRERPDAVVLAGDLLGCPGDGDHIEEQAADRLRVLSILADLAPPLFYVMGNDDWVELDSPLPSQQSVHGRRVDLGELNVVGYQCTVPFMGGVNEKPEAEIAEDLARLEASVDRSTLLITHGPAYGTLDRGILDRHAGSPSLRDLISRREPRVHVHGHVHRYFGREGRHFNVASGRRKQAMIIDVTTLEHRVVQEAACR